MITIIKKYTKTKNKKQKTDSQNPRTNGKNKAIDKITHRNIHIHTHKKRKRKYIYILLLPNPLSQFGMIRCLFRYSRDAGTSS